MKKFQAEKDQANRFQRNSSRINQQLNPNGSSYKGKQVQGVRSVQTPQYNTYKKFHFWECMSGMWKCYRCQEMGHILKDGPNPGAQRALIRGVCRVYTLEANKYKGNNDLISSTFYMHG